MREARNIIKEGLKAPVEEGKTKNEYHVWGHGEFTEGPDKKFVGTVTTKNGSVSAKSVEDLKKIGAASVTYCGQVDGKEIYINEIAVKILRTHIVPPPPVPDTATDKKRHGNS